MENAKMEDKLDFLDDKAEPVAEEVEPVIDEPVEVEAEAEPEQETGVIDEAVPPTPVVEEEKQIAPLAALLDEREKRQNIERERDDMRKQLQELQRAQAPQQQPDYFDNPQAAIEQRVMHAQLNQSRFLAERDFGKELVDEAYAFYDQNPAQTQQFLSHPSPFHAAVDAYKQQKFLQEVGSDPDAWREKQMEELRAQLVATPPTPTQAKPLPPSMAKAPSAGAGNANQSGSAFDQVFS